MPRLSISRSLPTAHAERRSAPLLPSPMSLLRLWLWRVRCRKELSALTLEQMRDTGLDPEVVRRQRRKPFWKA
jgi:uncharacterized protein YjiS (DUF1127 family)